MAKREMILLNPCNLLHSNDNYFNSKDLKFRSNVIGEQLYHIRTVSVISDGHNLVRITHVN